MLYVMDVEEWSCEDFRSVHDVKATALGVEQSRFKAELDFDGREITRAYLHQNVHLPTLLKVDCKNIDCLIKGSGCNGWE
ncbi:hypothetical protein TELCIR_24002, partial [Teladorsagia circumcincta]